MSSTNWGGKRSGAGRPRQYAGMEATHIRYAWTDEQGIMHNITAHVDRAEIIRAHLAMQGIPEGTPEEHLSYHDGHWYDTEGRDVCFPQKH